jgi:hypothetical protein
MAHPSSEQAIHSTAPDTKQDEWLIFDSDTT